MKAELLLQQFNCPALCVKRIPFHMEVTSGQYTAEPVPFINFHQSRSSSDDDDGDCQGNNFLGSADGHDGVRVILGHF